MRFSCCWSSDDPGSQNVLGNSSLQGVSAAETRSTCEDVRFRSSRCFQHRSQGVTRGEDFIAQGGGIRIKRRIVLGNLLLLRRTSPASGTACGVGTGGCGDGAAFTVTRNVVRPTLHMPEYQPSAAFHGVLLPVHQVRQEGCGRRSVIQCSAAARHLHRRSFFGGRQARRPAA